MADNSSIEWTDTTWNPIIGCTRVSSGCDHCYPIPLARIRERNPNPKVAVAFAGVVEDTENGLDWTGRVNLLPERLEQPLTWRKPRRIFVNSLSDLFHEAVPDEFIAKVFAVMALTPQHTYQLLSKRHGRMRSLLNSGHFVAKVWGEVDKRAPGVGAQAVSMWPSMPLPNVHLGVSVEDQKWADIRIPALLETPAAVRWISAEPLLGPVDLCGPIVNGHRPRLTYWLTGRPGWGNEHTTPTGLTMAEPVTGSRLDWVVVGGESGPGARPMHPDWARSLRDQCVSAGVPYFFKQWGAWEPIGPLYGDSDETEDAHMEAVAIEVHERRRVIQLERSGYVAEGYQPTDSRTWLMARVRGKKAAGRLLDGREWSEFPAFHAAGVSR